ncbi:hypothetical protein EL22_26595 [Halostagnicola sp. A56]|nr:hypothetical protein EL22_26595 [Halostagnicola sp. A56]
MEAVNSHLEGVKPLFDQISINVVELTAQPQSREGSQIAIAIDEKHRVVKVVFLGYSVQRRSSWIGSSPSKHYDIKNHP